MKKIISTLLCAVMVAGMLFGCGDKNAQTQGGDTQTQGTENETPAETVTIKVWHDSDEAVTAAIEETVNSQLADSGVQVSFEKKTGLTDQLKLYGNDAVNGPDMYLYAHDSLGTFVEMGILAPVTDMVSSDVMGGLYEMTVDAGNYDGTQYLLPLYYETLAFIYNNALWEGDMPATTDDLYDYMVAHTDAAAGTYAVVNQHSTAYNVAPFINGFGGYIIDKDGNPGLNVQETKDAIAYNQKFAALQADGDYNTVTTLFNEGKAAAIIGGPWLTSGIEDAGIDYTVCSLADFKLPNGNGLAPFAGVYGVGVMKQAAEDETKKAAVSKILEVLAGKKVGETLALTCGCAPANMAAYENADVASNQMLVAIQKTAKTAQPMPNIPEMSVMWGPSESMLAAVNKSGEAVDSAAETYQEQALTAIADMQ